MKKMFIKLYENKIVFVDNAGIYYCVYRLDEFDSLDAKMSNIIEQYTLELKYYQDKGFKLVFEFGEEVD